MKQVFYSDTLRQYFDTEEEGLQAEEAFRAAQEEKKAKEEKRAERAKEVQDAFELAREADRRAQDLLKEFCKDYGKFHMSVQEPFDSIFRSFWNLI